LNKSARCAIFRQRQQDQVKILKNVDWIRNKQPRYIKRQGLSIHAVEKRRRKNARDTRRQCFFLMLSEIGTVSQLQYKFALRPQSK